MIIATLLKMALASAVLWLVYIGLFRNTNRFVFNRYFLLGSLLFSIALPFIGKWMGNGLKTVANLRQDVLGSFSLDEFVVGASNQVSTTASSFSLGNVVMAVYLLGITIAAILFFVKIIRLTNLIAHSPKQKRENYTLVITGKNHSPYSFFRHVFFSEEPINEDILRHELSHISQRHSWDILFVEVMMIFQWFNPILLLYKRELQCLHEYAADHEVVYSGADKKNYMKLILQQCTAADYSNMTNNFSLILTKKRISMIIKDQKVKSLWWRVLTAVPVVAIMLVANTKVMAQDNVKVKTDTEKTTYVLNKEDVSKTTIKDAKSAPQNEEVFEKCEVMPEFPGGIDGLIEYLSTSCNYPEEEKQKDIEGKVFVQFVIEKDGAVSNVKVLKSAQENLDKEAVRVVENMPKWTPGMDKGKPVRVSYVLPISFKLQ